MTDFSKSVPKGGLFGASQHTYSNETQELLKVMMEESKLTNFQRRQLNSTLQNKGTSFPGHVKPTTSEIRKRSPVKTTIPSTNTMRGHTTPGLRTIESIEQSGAYERDQFVPKPIVSRDKEKERFSNLMTFGEELPPKPAKPSVRRAPSPPPDRFEEIQKEIAERQSFLEQMRGLGQSKHHEAVIATQISQLIREMEEIDRKKNIELEKAIAKETKKH